MKTFNSTAREIGARPKHGHTLYIRYSKTDFFCEGQEKRSESTEKVSSKKTVPKSKIHERFFGHFNMFL
jgi:hypothetical protein